MKKVFTAMEQARKIEQDIFDNHMGWLLVVIDNQLKLIDDKQYRYAIVNGDSVTIIKEISGCETEECSGLEDVKEMGYMDETIEEYLIDALRLKDIEL